MERNEFIKSLGLGIAMVCTGSCLSSCGGSKTDDPAPGPGGGAAAGSKVNVDLNSQLLAVGSFLSTGGVLFVRLANGNTPASFVATQASCPHQGGALNWIQANNFIQCSLHASRYSPSGAVIAQPNDGGTTTALKIYTTTITGNTLTATIS